MDGIYNWYKQTIRNPKYRWWIILGTVAYLLMPFDFLPDFIPVIGQLDDVLVITLLFTEVSQLLIDRVRTKKGTEVSDATTGNAKTDADGNPVDVKAVPIE
jgi:uncharacterized membrane protein YkvA (DUF1232 family)